MDKKKSSSSSNGNGNDNGSGKQQQQYAIHTLAQLSSFGRMYLYVRGHKGQIHVNKIQ